MFDFLDKYHENNKISEGLFDKIFGKKNVTPQAQSNQQAQAQPNPQAQAQSNQQAQAQPNPQAQAQPNTQAQTNTRKAQKAPKVEFERGKVYDFDLTRIPILGKFSNPITGLSFKSPEDFAAFKAIMYYLNAGYFDNDIHNLQRAIKYGEVDGYGQFVYLSSIFNNNKGTTFQVTQPKNIKEVGNIKFNMPNKSTLQPKQAAYKQVQATNSEGFSAIDSMRRLEKFVKYFIENIVDINGVPNKSLRNSIILRLKKLIGTNALAPKKVNKVPTQIPQGPIEPGAKPEDIENNGGQAVDYALKGLKESVRKIITDNF